MREAWTGVGTALITPFTKTGDLDEPAIRRLARRQIDAGVHFLVPCGTTGETPTLSDAEKRRVVELVVEEANGQVPVMAGAGGNTTRKGRPRGQGDQRAGATGLLSVTPNNKPRPGAVPAFLGRGGTPLPSCSPASPGTGAAWTRHRGAARPRVIGVGSVGNISRWPGSCGPSGRFPCAVRRRCHHHSADGNRRAGIISVASGRIGEWQMVRRRNAGLPGAATAQRLLLLLVNFIESTPA
jgi:hypothetical protein